MTPRRSVLFLPASNPRAVARARQAPADVVILDLEDAAGPDEKSAGRQAAVAALRQGGFAACQVGVRINGLNTPWGLDDLDALALAAPDVLVAPKVESAGDVAAHVARMAPEAELWAMIETPLALFNLPVIAAAPRLGALMVGVNDLSAMMRLGPGGQRESLKTALFMTVAAARAHGLAAIDGVFNALDDPEGLRRECEQGRMFGFDGKSVIHPGQIETANRAFSPSAEETDWAREVIEAFSRPENADLGVVSVRGKMTERLHLEAARRVIALHDLVGRA